MGFGAESVYSIKFKFRHCRVLLVLFASDAERVRVSLIKSSSGMLFVIELWAGLRGFYIFEPPVTERHVSSSVRIYLVFNDLV